MGCQCYGKVRASGGWLSWSYHQCGKSSGNRRPEGSACLCCVQGCCDWYDASNGPDLARYGIRVMTVAPGIIDTGVFDKMPDKMKKGLLAPVAYPQRFGKPEEFAHMVASIIDNMYLNGEVIRMDGGSRFANL